MTALVCEIETMDQGCSPVHEHLRPHACLIVGGSMLDRQWTRRDIPATPSEMFIYRPGLGHEIEAGKSGLLCIVVEWSESARVRNFGATRIERPLSQMEKLAETGLSKNPARRTIARREILAEMNRVARAEAYREPPDWLVEAYAAMQGDLAHRMTVSALARHAGVHRATLTQGFRDYFGLAPEQFRILVKLEHVAASLEAGARPSAAALDGGFSDQAHLNRMWRRYLGGAPRRWIDAQATIVQD